MAAALGLAQGRRDRRLRRRHVRPRLHPRRPGLRPLAQGLGVRYVEQCDARLAAPSERDHARESGGGRHAAGDPQRPACSDGRDEDPATRERDELGGVAQPVERRECAAVLGRIGTRWWISVRKPVFFTPWPAPPTSHHASMNGKTVQNGAMNFARPCTAAASSVAVASAWSRDACGSVFEATIIPTAHALRTIPIPTSPVAELSRRRRSRRGSTPT